MAIGIDSIAHETALQEKGKTIAVLPSGLEHIYPKENIKLYRKIIKNQGLVITEYLPNQEAESKKFLERNRIVSGLALGVIVIEATYRSGTSVTAKLAKKQGRKVFAVPHEINDIHGIGTNRLIRKGAKIVTNAKDIIEEFPFITYKEIKYETQKQGNKKQRKICKNKDYNKIYKLITEETITLDEIYKKTNESISKVNNILLMLELEGYIKKVVGGYVCILDER